VGRPGVAQGQNSDRARPGRQSQLGILDRNWLHIQDGTGKIDDGSHDLTVTTAGTAKVGDIVTVTRRLAIDKDFGAGYAYKVIVEDATIKPAVKKATLRRLFGVC